MNRTLTALLLAACAITTSSLAWAQDTALDGKKAFDIAVESAAAGDQRCNALLPLLKPQ